MTVNTRKKAAHRKGYRAHCGKRRRGHGNKGGVGRAGHGKRAKQKKHMFIAEPKKRGFIRHALLREMKTMNLYEIALKYPTEKEIDLGNVKVLSKGNIKRAVKIKAAVFTEKAKEKIKAAGGEVLQ